MNVPKAQYPDGLNTLKYLAVILTRYTAYILTSVNPEIKNSVSQFILSYEYWNLSPFVYEHPNPPGNSGSKWET